MIVETFSNKIISAIGTMPEECGFNIIDVDPKSDIEGRSEEELIDFIKKSYKYILMYIRVPVKIFLDS